MWVPALRPVWTAQLQPIACAVLPPIPNQSSSHSPNCTLDVKSMSSSSVIKQALLVLAILLHLQRTNTPFTRLRIFLSPRHCKLSQNYLHPLSSCFCTYPCPCLPPSLPRANHVRETYLRHRGVHYRFPQYATFSVISPCINPITLCTLPMPLSPCVDSQTFDT